MKLTFPYMGTVVIYKKIFEMLGHEVIVPPRPTKNTISLGVKHSPEFACFPYKTIMGSYLEALELGAEAIVTSGGFGPCRAGFYGEVHKKTLESLDYKNIDVMVLESSKRDSKYFWNVIKKLRGKSSWWKMLKSAYIVYKMAHALDELEKIVQERRAYEVKEGSFSTAWDKINTMFDKQVQTTKDVVRIKKEAFAILDTIPIKKPPQEEKIRIGIVGEIFVVMESAINLDIEKVLNSLGCEVERNQYLSEWVDDNLIPKFLNRNKNHKYIIELSREYMEVPIGGHENETIGHIIDYKKRGFDGVVHLMPFACLPELISQSIIPKVSKDYDIPVFTISIDEQTAIANQMTRIEAFVELLRGRKRAKE